MRIPPSNAVIVGSSRSYAFALVVLASACAEHHVVDDMPFGGSCTVVYSDCGERPWWQLWGVTTRTCTSAQLSLRCGETAAVRSGDTYECRCGAAAAP